MGLPKIHVRFLATERYGQFVTYVKDGDPVEQRRFKDFHKAFEYAQRLAKKRKCEVILY